MHEEEIRYFRHFPIGHGMIIVSMVLSVVLPAIAWAQTPLQTADAVSPRQNVKRPRCGLYCLYVVIKVSGQDPNFCDLVTPEYLDTPRGSTLSGLMRAAEDAGLYADIMDKGTSRVLRACPYPVILHVRGSDVSDRYDHFVLYLGVDGERARIYDPPEHEIKLISFAQLTSLWDGKGLVLSSEPVKMKGFVWAERMRLLLVSSAAILLILLVHAVRRPIPWPLSWKHPSIRAAMSMAQIGILGVLAAIIAFGFHSVSEAGFFAYPKGVASVKKAHATDFIPRIGLSTAKRLLGSEAVFIDARLPRDFAGGHIDGAVNVPVDANDAVRQHRIEVVPLHTPLVVYCQSAKCRYAETVALKLQTDGFNNISIFRGGWLEWSGQVQPARTERLERKSSGKWRIKDDGTASPQ